MQVGCILIESDLSIMPKVSRQSRAEQSEQWSWSSLWLPWFVWVPPGRGGGTGACAGETFSALSPARKFFGLISRELPHCCPSSSPFPSSTACPLLTSSSNAAGESPKDLVNPELVRQTNWIGNALSPFPVQSDFSCSCAGPRTNVVT